MLTAEFSPANNAFVTILTGPDGATPCAVGTEHRTIWNDLDELRFSMKTVGMRLRRIRAGLFEICPFSEDAV